MKEKLEMAGTKEGAKKALATNKKIYGKDFYKRIGRLGGKKGTTGGFYANRELASIAGKIGGLKSSRKNIKNGFGKNKLKSERK